MLGSSASYLVPVPGRMTEGNHDTGGAARKADHEEPGKNRMILRSDQYNRDPGTRYMVPGPVTGSIISRVTHHTFIVPHYFFTKYKNRTIPDS